jgi:6-carboxyhexanoate--CoA ligase
MDKKLFSIRMRASNGNTHISGAERIVREEDINNAFSELITRANTHERGIPTNINIAIDSLEGREILALPPLPVRSLDTADVCKGRERAIEEIVRAGVSNTAAMSAMSAITSGSAMHGAIIMDSLSGGRLETDSTKGIRTRVVDYDETFLHGLNRELEFTGLGNSRLADALALATKVAGAPGAVAELCISDDPGYVTGYVASPEYGYVRITPLKPEGDLAGGRVFFVDSDSFDLEAYTAYLRETPVLVSGELEIL